MTNFNFLLNNLSYLSNEDLVVRPMDSTCFRSAPVPPSFRLRLHPLRMVATLLLLLCLSVGNVWGTDVTGTINFGSRSGSLNINSASVSGNDSQTNSWTVTTVGTTSFTPNASYAQVGSSKNPATSITFTTTLAASQTITAMSAKFGGFSGTAGTITLKVGDNTIGTGSLSASTDVTVTATDNTKSGKVLTVTVTGISKGVKCYYISYTYSNTPACSNNVTINKGTPVTGSSFSLDKTGSQATCNGLTVTVSGITPPSHYHFSAISQSGVAANKVTIDNSAKTVTYAANTTGTSTINIAYEEDPQYTVTWVAGGNSSFHTQTSYTGTALTAPGTPDASTYCPGGKVFVGWTATEIDGTTNTQPADLFTSVSGMSIPATNKTYYAVFATSGSSSKTYSFSITASYFNSTSYAANNNEKTSTATATDASGATMDVKWTSNQIMLQSSAMQWQKNNGYIYNSTDLGTINSVTVTSSAGTFTTYYGTTSQPSSGTQGTGNGYFKTSVGNATGTTSNVAVNFTKTTTSYSNYATTCCTPLGSINGSISENTPTSVTLTWSAVSGAEKYQVKVPGSSSHDSWTDAVSGVSVTKSCGTAYTAYFRAIDTNGSHCAEGPESTLAIPAVSWTVTSTGVTNATASPAIPSTTCSGFSTTISPAAGYALPAEITVTNASKSWNSSTGALSISSVTGNVSITITPTCVSPDITADPADADYYVDDDPTPLSVTATLASGTRTYLWKVSTNGGSTWSDATGTNNAATYSGASLSTASAGTLKFKCIVGNSQGGCTVESEVATITVAEPSSWKFKYSGDEWIEHTMIEDAGEVSYSISLAADSRFEFGFDGGSFYKNNGTIITTTSGWVFNTTDNNCHIHTGPAGIYTFTINTTTKAVTVTYPTVSHPNEHYVYFKNTNVWGTVYGYLANSGNDYKAAAWPGSVMQPTTSICGETYHYAALNAMSGTYNTIIFNNGSDGYGNQTSDLSTTGSLGKYNANQDDSWHQFKYAINFDKGTGSGDAMVSIENLCPGSNQALTANTYTKEHNTFAGWIADVDVKVGESTIDAGEIIDDEVTIKDIQSDINLTAQWTPNTYTITKTFSNVANAGLPSSFTYTGATTTALNSTFTVDATNFFLPSSIAVTMGGTPLTAGTDYTYNNSTGAFTFSAVITGDIDITATATAKLKSIAITMLPTTRKYFAGESFSSTGAVVTATMGDGSTKPVSVTWDLTTLTAGAGQTVTASYSEGGIDQTATTTIDVYSVTVNKVNEDGDAISADGVTATWTVGSKTIAASATSASKYVFKQWDVTGATAASTSSASTTLSSPTANVVVNAIFYKPRVVKWSVNGNDSYNTGGPTTTVAYNGTISTVPTDPSGLACASTFVAWTDAAHNNGQTAKDDDSYYGSALYTAAGDFPNITAETTTFYAVFAERSNSDGYKYIGDDGTLTDGKKYIFVNAKSAGSAYALKATDLAAPNSGNNGTAVSVTVTSNAEGVLVTTINTALEFEYVSSGTKLKYEVDGPATRYLFINGDGVGMKSDESRSRYTTDAGLQGWNNKVNTYYDVYYNSTNEKFERKESAGSRVYAFIKQTATYGNYVTECDANIVKVTYNANGGATSCTNTTTDKTEDYTVCSTPPTRDYYTFAGWLCSADSKTYAANATISAAAIDADFTLTAQWTPLPYSITYELHDGTTAGGNPTTYNIETATIDLADGTYGHNRFEGWYSTYNDGTGAYSDQVTSIPLGSHGDITLHAKWAARHEIIFDADGVTTTIYRADDENMEDAVTGMGSKPANPSAPSACSTKVFVGWSESTIDNETDTEPADLFDGTGAVDEDKHYYAVWANEHSESGTVKLLEDALNITGSDQVTTRSGWTLNDKMYAGGGSIRFSTGGGAGMMTVVKTGMGFGTTVTTATITFKIKKYGSDDSGDLQISSGYSDATTTFSKDGGLTSGSSVAYSTTDGSNWTTCTCTIANIHSGTDIILEGTKNKRVYLKDFLLSYSGTVYTYDGYSTSCCATKVTLSDPSITGTGATITFDKSSPIWTCGGSKTVTATVTVTTGYQVTELSFSGGSVSVSPTISTPLTSSQNYTLTFADGTNATLTTTATVSAKPLNSITITPSSGEVYVGQYVDFTVSYDPADYLSKGYTLNATPVYVTKESAAPANTKLRLKGGRGSGPGASITETVNETVTIKASGDNTKTASVNMTVNPLPRVHFEDLVHGKAFADVAATIEANALSATKTTPTSDDWTTPNANDCEENHLHLVGWIRSDWPALVNYLNGTGDAPTTVAITGAGNDGSGNAYFFAPNASINVLTFNGATFYAVWAEIK